MEQNRFKPYNKSMLVNVLMSSEYKDIWYRADYVINTIPMYDEINKTDTYGTILMWACYYERINVARLLLQHPDINVNIKNRNGATALDFAVYNVNVINVFGKNVLHYAVINNNKKIVKLLLAQRKDIDVNIQDNNGYTALDYAKKYNHKDIINLLEKHNAK